MNSAQPRVYGNTYRHTEGLSLKNGANFFHMPASTIYYKYLQQTKKIPQVTCSHSDSDS